MKESAKDGGELMADLDSAAQAAYSGKRILVTGAAGSIGSQLIVHLLRYSPAKIVALDKDENAIYELEQELRLRRAAVPIEPCVADMRDAGRLQSICQACAPQVVFHVAGYKHVPLMELHPSEAILGNVMGTKNLLDVIAGFGAERFVFVSSDKAVNPVSVMGATKRIGELLVRAAAQSGRVQAASVRFGNVLGSRGSVVPLFQRQIAEGGPVTVTHSEMVRYFMSMQQAIQLILAAGCEARNGEIFVAEMGRARNIHELAREMILLAGLEPEKDIEIRIVGLRPGERLSEQPVAHAESVSKTRFKGLSSIAPPQVDHRTLMQNISLLVQTARSAELQGIYPILGMMGLGYKHFAQPAVLKSRPAANPLPGEPLSSLQSSIPERALRADAAS